MEFWEAKLRIWFGLTRCEDCHKKIWFFQKYEGYLRPPFHRIEVRHETCIKAKKFFAEL